MAAPHPEYKRSPRKSLNIDQLQDVILPIRLELGRKDLRVQELLEMKESSVIQLHRLAGETVDLVVNEKVLAKGEVVVIDESFGVRIVTLLSPEERLKHM